LLSNDGIQNLEGLQNLSTVGVILIQDNKGLRSLDGLEQLSMVNDSLDIIYNRLLSNCCAIQDFMLTAPPETIFNIYENITQCENRDVVRFTRCGLTTDPYVNNPCLDSDNGSIQIKMSGYKDVPFLYNWTRVDDGTTGTGESYDDFFIIDNLPAGNYEICVNTPTPDSVKIVNVNLEEVPGTVFEVIGIRTTNSSNNLNNGSVDISIAGGIPPYAIDYTGPVSDLIVAITSTEYTIPDLSAGEYSIKIIDDTGKAIYYTVLLQDVISPTVACIEPLDIVILNDVSNSVDSEEHEESKLFFTDFILAANIGPEPNQSRASIIEWSEESSLVISMTGDTTLTQEL